MNKIEKIILGRERDLGGFTVRRILPSPIQAMVGPFIFFDHMGPAEFNPGEGINVRPHPHINLATVTYLFEGKILHRDSLGSNQLIEPGAINWMTAGRGVVHSERTPEDLREKKKRLNGIQCWVALPNEKEEVEPSFAHHPSESLPEFQIEEVKLKLLLGTFLGKSSPVPVHSDLLYVDMEIPKNSRFEFPAEEREMALYLVEGKIGTGEEILEKYSMAILPLGKKLTMEAKENSRLMILGGKPLGMRYIHWNFVSSSAERIEKAKKDWLEFAHSENSNFSKVPGDDQEFIPLPEEKS